VFCESEFEEYYNNIVQWLHASQQEVVLGRWLTEHLSQCSEVRHCLHTGLQRRLPSSLQFSLLVKDRVVFIKFSLSSFWNTRGSSIIPPLQWELFHPSLVIVFRLDHGQYLQTSFDESINDSFFFYPVSPLNSYV
jgi:hypothetical protein